MPKINYEIKTDRELLVLTAQKSNETASETKRLAKEIKILNGTVKSHDSRIVELEVKGKMKPSSTFNKISHFGRGYPGAIVVLGAIIASVHYIGRAFGWWG